MGRIENLEIIWFLEQRLNVTQQGLNLHVDVYEWITTTLKDKLPYEFATA